MWLMCLVSVACLLLTCLTCFSWITCVLCGDTCVDFRHVSVGHVPGVTCAWDEACVLKKGMCGMCMGWMNIGMCSLSWAMNTGRGSACHELWIQHGWYVMSYEYWQGFSMSWAMNTAWVVCHELWMLARVRYVMSYEYWHGWYVMCGVSWVDEYRHMWC